jgi:hypothetical protein
LSEREPEHRERDGQAMPEAARNGRKYHQADALADQIGREDRSKLGDAEIERAGDAGRQRAEDRVDQPVEQVDRVQMAIVPVASGR